MYINVQTYCPEIMSQKKQISLFEITLMRTKLKASLPNNNNLDFNFEIIIFESLTLISQKRAKLIFHYFALYITKQQYFCPTYVSC